MTVHTLLRHLPHFSGGVIARPVAGPAAAARTQAAPASFSRDEVARAADVARRAAQAETEAARMACAAAREDLARLEASMDDRLAAARAEWCRTEGDRLTAALKDATADLANRIGDTLAGILAPFVTGAVRAHALDDMTERLTGLLGQSSADPVLEVSGNADLVAELQRRLGDASGVAFRTGPETDVRVVGGDTVIETQLAAWAALLDQTQSRQ